MSSGSCGHSRWITCCFEWQPLLTQLSQLVAVHLPPQRTHFISLDDLANADAAALPLLPLIRQCRNSPDYHVDTVNPMFLKTPFNAHTFDSRAGPRNNKNLLHLDSKCEIRVGFCLTHLITTQPVCLFFSFGGAGVRFRKE